MKAHHKYIGLDVHTERNDTALDHLGLNSNGGNRADCLTIRDEASNHGTSLTR